MFSTSLSPLSRSPRSCSISQNYTQPNRYCGPWGSTTGVKKWENIKSRSGRLWVWCRRLVGGNSEPTLVPTVPQMTLIVSVKTRTLVIASICAACSFVCCSVTKGFFCRWITWRSVCILYKRNTWWSLTSHLHPQTSSRYHCSCYHTCMCWSLRVFSSPVAIIPLWDCVRLRQKRTGVWCHINSSSLC